VNAAIEAACDAETALGSLLSRAAASTR
jgi:hypothetical protein